MASSIDSPWLVVPVSGFNATYPPSWAGVNTAVSSMASPVEEVDFRSMAENLATAKPNVGAQRRLTATDRSGSEGKKRSSVRLQRPCYASYVGSYISLIAGTY